MGILLSADNEDLDDGLRVLLAKHSGNEHYAWAWTMLFYNDERVPIEAKEVIVAAAIEVESKAGLMARSYTLTDRNDRFASVVEAVSDARIFDEEAFTEILDEWKGELLVNKFMDRGRTADWPTKQPVDWWAVARWVAFLPISAAAGICGAVVGGVLTALILDFNRYNMQSLIAALLVFFDAGMLGGAAAMFAGLSIIHKESRVLAAQFIMGIILLWCGFELCRIVAMGQWVALAMVVGSIISGGVSALSIIESKK